jgi:capsular polysaccharide biosynthesis protein
MWRNLYPVYVNHIAIHFRHIKARRWLHLTRLSEFAKTREIPSIQVTDAALVETPAPTVLPACDQDYLASPHDRYNFPSIYVATISHGIIYGGTNLVLTKDEVICHDLYDFERDYTSEELLGRNLLDPKKSRIRWLVHDESPVHLPAAADFVDACATNYAHWLTEVLPRIAVFCAEEQFKGVPIVVNDGLHKNIMESLFLVAGSEREVVTLPIGRAIQVDALYLTSVAGYVPFDRRNKKLDGHSHGLFSPPAFELIRRQVASFVGKLPEQPWPEKIYLRRNSGVRKVTNATELEELLVAKGCVIVEPENLSFLQQAQLFTHAKVIIGSSGAALANIVFAPPNVKVFILIGKYPDTSYWYWQNIACASSKTVSYVFGEVAGSASGIHADFTVDLDVFALLIEGVEQQ